MRASILVFGPLVLLAPLGCDVVKVPEAVNKGVQQANQHVQQSVETVKNQVLPPGIELTTTPPIKASTCYGAWLPPTLNRPAVLTLASYREGSAMTYPTIYARVKAVSPSLDELKGKTVEAELLYVQRSAEEPVLQAPRTEPVQLKIDSVQGKTVVATVVKGSLVNAETGDVAPFLGKLTAEIE
jgi:hypothetical protein